MKQNLSKTTMTLAVIFMLAIFQTGVTARSDAPRAEQPTGRISQKTVSSTEIRHSEWLSPDRNQIWVITHIEGNPNARSAILIDLNDHQSKLVVEHALPMAWLNENEVLFYQSEMIDPFWKKILRKMGVKIPKTYETRFFRFTLDTRSFVRLTEIETEYIMTSWTISPNREWLVVTWGLEICYEINLSQPDSVQKIDERYLWQPSFVSDREFVFIGDTVVHMREVDQKQSKRISQPLLKEIRDAIRVKGTPRVRPLEKVDNRILLLDIDTGRNFDQLMELDQTTSLVQSICQLRSMKQTPSISPTGKQLVYQGQSNNQNEDAIYLQSIEPDSSPKQILPDTLRYSQNATPVFRTEDEVLYIHEGVELRSLMLSQGEVQLHWPTSVLPTIMD